MRLLLVVLWCSASCIAQNKSHHKNVVECYYDDESKYILIYDNKNGSVLDTLHHTKESNSWYKFAIAESDYGWFKIKNIKSLTNNNTTYNYKNFWVKNKGFYVTVINKDEDHSYIYDLPTTSSNRIHKLDLGQKVQITEISELWVKIELTVGKKIVKGWLPYSNQCAFPIQYCFSNE